MTEFESHADEDHPISKTQRKQHMHALQALGEALLALPPEQQQQFPLSEDLQAALDEARRITKREALRRHKQYIGRLMRAEPEIERIQAKLDAMQAAVDAQSRQFKELEAMRDALINGGKEAIGAVIERFPDVDRQKLRQLVKQAQHERQRIDSGDSSVKPAKARALFRFLRDTHQDHC